jgi:hypothetical protein
MSPVLIPLFALLALFALFGLGIIQVTLTFCKHILRAASSFAQGILAYFGAASEQLLDNEDDDDE